VLFAVEQEVGNGDLGGGTMKVLVVDDSRAMRMIISRELRQAGVTEVIEAEDAPSAADVLGQQMVDFVISDWNMPGLSGLDFLRHLRSHGWTGLFGFVTTESGQDTQQQAFEAGASFVVIKPFSGEELVQKMSLALAGGQGVAVSAEPTATSEDDNSEVATTLERLLGREVTVEAIRDDPRKDVARVVATYVDMNGEDAGVCITELAVAAAAGAALSMIPAAAVADWVRSGTLSEMIEQNFHEVANVLSNLVSPGKGRCLLSDVSIYADFEQLPMQDRITVAPHKDNLSVSIDGYEPGRMALIGF
jgi:two-component system chemotaxis response regulator CheY